MDSVEIETAAAVSLEFPASDTMSFSKVPSRIRKRLVEEYHKTPTSADEIETKLRLAHLRRQQFYESVSSKARPKPRSPSSSSSHEDDLGQRLEARLQAAEQKRLSILAKAQMRLAKLDELRQAAKTGAEMRYEREREKLGTKVESRVQKAEANRMLILKAYNQKRASLKERSSQSILRRMVRDNKYKERVRAAIYHKRAAAEKKRLGLLEAEKKRACARVLQVRDVAKFVSHQRETERRRLRDQLEDKLQRAKRQRAEFLRQRGRLHDSGRVNLNKMRKQADLLARKLAKHWRDFIRLQGTTLDLARAYDALNINEKWVKSMPFEQFADLIESPATLRTVKALLDRLETRFNISKADAATSFSSIVDNIDHLLKRVASPKKRTTRASPKRREGKKVPTSRGIAGNPIKLPRYPVRIVLSAYMILGHPDAVFSSQGEREIFLNKAAKEFVREFELLIRVIIEGPVRTSSDKSDSLIPKTLRTQLTVFDRAWCAYLNCFVVWKVKDAQLLEDDLVRAACQLELSMIQKCKLSSEEDDTVLTHDMKAIQNQVTEDQKLIREKVHHLSGDAGIARMESALSETRSNYFQAKANGNQKASPINIISLGSSSSLDVSSLTSFNGTTNLNRGTDGQNKVVRSLFKEDNGSPSRNVSFHQPGGKSVDAQLGSSLEKENELIVNEFLHLPHLAFADRFNIKVEDPNNVEAKVRKTMEIAFWDVITESIKRDEPNYDRVIQLVKEVKDELCEMAPQSWRAEIAEAIDLEILCQLLRSGKMDDNYLKQMLEFALVTLQKLSAPASDDIMKANHQTILKTLAETRQTGDESHNTHVIVMIRGLRFVLEQIQDLKREISKARINFLEPLLKGPAGYDYLRKAFANRYGSPSEAITSLPTTMRWLSSESNSKEQEWEKHKSLMSALPRNGSFSQDLVPSASLKTGGTFMVRTDVNQTPASSPAATNSTGDEQTECKGDKIDMLVRLGLLKLVSGLSGLTPEILPETFRLNFSRLRGVQADIQKIIVISTSILICQQILVSEKVVATPTEMQSVLSKYVKQLLELLDGAEDVGIEEIVKIVSVFPGDDEVAALGSRKVLMGRLIGKSLQAGDPVFEKVSQAVYLAARGVVLGGTGFRGTTLTKTALGQIGAALLTERVVEAARVLVVAASVSVNVHGPWYSNLIK